MTVPLERQKNIADVAARVREQLGLGSAAVSEQSDFATAAQGDKADSALPANELPIYATVIGMPALEIPAGINAIRVNGRNAAGDGLGGLFIDTNNGSSDTFTSADGRTWYRAADVSRLVSISQAATLNFGDGDRASINGMIFVATSVRPLQASLPIIPTLNGKFLVPLKAETARNLSSWVLKSTTGPYSQSSAPYRLLQTVEIDYRNGRIFFFYSDSYTGDYQNEFCSIIEYQYNVSTGVVGSYVKSAHDLQIAHGDSAALYVNADGTRTILTVQQTTAASFGVRRVVKIDWDSGAISNASIQTVYSPGTYVSVAWYDSNTILLSDQILPQLVDAADLLNGAITSRGHLPPSHVDVAPFSQTFQQMKYWQGEGWGVGGGLPNGPIDAIIQRLDGATPIESYRVYIPSLIGVNSEVESVGLRFDVSTGRFVPQTFIANNATGEVLTYSLEEAGDGEASLAQRFLMGLKAVMANGVTRVLAAVPAALGARHLYLLAQGEAADSLRISNQYNGGVVSGNVRYSNEIAAFENQGTVVMCLTNLVELRQADNDPGSGNGNRSVF